MEHGFLKAPWEVLVRTFRAGHKPVAKEVDMFSTAVDQLIQQALAAKQFMEVDGQSEPSPIQPPTIAALQTRLTGLKRKLEHIRSIDDHSMSRCFHRIAYLHARASCSHPPSFSVPAVDAAAMMDDPMSIPTSAVGLPRSSPTDLANPDNAKDEDDSENTKNAKKTGAVANGTAQTNGTTNDISSPVTTVDRQSRWEKLHLDRALVDYMSREGMYDTAHMLSKSHAIENIVDTDIFRESRVVIEALRRRDCSEGLRWCAENKRRLQKVQSKLDFQFRLQEFVELARARRKTDAIMYMRKYLTAHCDSERFRDIQRFMALLAFGPNTTCSNYKDMYGDHKWLDLEIAFKHDNYRLHGLTRESTIEILLKAGMASLKTKKCGTDVHKRPTCPTCVEPYVSLAGALPRSRHENSILVCSITGEIMDENNPPMAMPKGNVYSLKALKKIADDNDGIIMDPRTKDTARFGELRKCFIM